MHCARLLVVALALVAPGLTGCSGDAPASDTATVPRAEPTGGIAEEVEVDTDASAPPVRKGFDLTRHSTRDPRSTWVVVNRRRPLRPPTYTPDLDLVEGYFVHPRVVRPLTRLLATGRRHGLDLRLMSAYRSYGRQADLHAGAVAVRGPRQRTTAPAGASEHQTGLAVDLGRATTGACNVTSCFAGTREGRWLRRNAHRFGFVLRYPAGRARITGYAHESWHFRHVGRPLARHLHRERIPTLEEAFGLVGGPS